MMQFESFCCNLNHFNAVWISLLPKIIKRKYEIITTNLPTNPGSLIPIALDSSLDTFIVEYAKKELTKNKSISWFCKNLNICDLQSCLVMQREWCWMLRQWVVCDSEDSATVSIRRQGCCDTDAATVMMQQQACWNREVACAFDDQERMICSESDEINRLRMRLRIRKYRSAARVMAL